MVDRSAGNIATEAIAKAKFSSSPLVVLFEQIRVEADKRQLAVFPDVDVFKVTDEMGLLHVSDTLRETANWFNETYGTEL